MRSTNASAYLSEVELVRSVPVMQLVDVRLVDDKTVANSRLRETSFTNLIFRIIIMKLDDIRQTNHNPQSTPFIIY